MMNSTEQQDVSDRPGKYSVFVAENSHYMDESAEWKQGCYPSYEEALAVARRIVDESLAEFYTPGMRPGSLISFYRTFGDDPFIVPDDGPERFSAWSYAESRSKEICDAKTSADDK
jgi:hypothetical protein